MKNKFFICLLSYENLILDKNKINSSESARMSVDVTNTGLVEGEEVIQLYISSINDKKAIKTLRGFNRINLHPNEIKTVSFEITPYNLSRWIDGKGFSIDNSQKINLVVE
jgi:beta-glucosidase